MRQPYKTFILWALLIVIFVSCYQIFSRQAKDTNEEPFSTFISQIDKNQVKEVEIKGLVHEGRLADGRAFRTYGPEDSALLDRMQSHHVTVTFAKEDQSPLWLQIAAQWLPIAFLVLILVFFMRQIQAGGGKAMSFGKSKARLLSEHHNRVTFDDVAGIDESKEELEEIIAFLKDPKKFTKLGGRIPKGVLLMGSPGTGKTLLARAVAGEAGVPFFSISGSDFVEMFVGVGASRVRDLFEQGKKNAPCIIFIDEIDAVGRHRGAGLGGGHDEREQTLNQLLVEMDGFESNDGVILIAATNRPDVLDPALLRPGRFDRRIVVPRPDVKGREGILRVHTRRTPLSPEVDLNLVARGTPGFSGADLENLVNEAALVAARMNKERLETNDFEFAKDKVMMGSERRSMIISDAEKRNTAVHEAGHTLVARSLPGCDPVHKVTIIPRGPALGLTQMIPAEDRLNAYKGNLLDRIAMCMGGRIAEEITFHEMSAGASNDLEKATEIARRMVCELGMSEKLGPVTYGQREGEMFLAREMTSRARDYSEKTAIEIDEEVRRLVTEQYQRARQILVEKREQLDRLAAALLEHETLDGAEVDLVLAGGTITRARLASRPALPKQPDRPREKKTILDALELPAGLNPTPRKA